MNKRFSRVISLVLCIVMCFGCTVFASEPTSSCNHIKGELVIDLNNENIAKAFLDLGGNKEEDIDMFFYDGPLDFYYQEEELYNDSENGLIDLVTDELMKNEYIREYIEYYYEDDFKGLNKTEKKLLEREIYEELKEEMAYVFEDYYIGYPYVYKFFKELEYNSIKVVYDIYTYLPDKVNTDIKLTVYVLSDNVNNNITIPLHLIIDENAILISNDIVFSVYDLACKIDSKAPFASIEYRNLLYEQLSSYDYLEIKKDEYSYDYEEFEVIFENEDSIEKFILNIFNIYEDLDFNKYITKGSEIVLTADNIEKLFEEILIYSYKHYDDIYDTVMDSFLELYFDIMYKTSSAEGYTEEEFRSALKEMIELEETEKLTFEFENKCILFMLLNALDVHSENKGMIDDLGNLYSQLKQEEVASSQVHDCELNCLPYYRYNYDTVKEYLLDYFFEEELFELSAFYNVIKKKTENSYLKSKNSVDLLKGLINFENELYVEYNNNSLVKVLNKYTVDNKENKVITTDIEKKCDIDKVNYMIKTVENIICPINTLEITYNFNHNFDNDYERYCRVESIHFDNSKTTDYSVDYKLVNGSFFIKADVIEACYNLKLTEKEVDGVKYFVSVLYDKDKDKEEEVLLDYYIDGEMEYLKVRDLEKLGYSIKYRQEFEKYYTKNIITISK